MITPATSKVSLLDKPIATLHGVGPAKANLLAEELQLFTLGDLLYAYPFRYVDRTKFHAIIDIIPNGEALQIKGKLVTMNQVGEGRGKRMTGRLRDESGAALELVWFRGIHLLYRMYKIGEEYIVYGKVEQFNNRLSITHPEMELAARVGNLDQATFEPVYASTEKLNKRALDARGRRKLIKALFDKLKPADLPEILPRSLVQGLRLMSRGLALKNLHLPPDQKSLDGAIRRMKFEELFLLQLRLLQLKLVRENQIAGYSFGSIGTIFTEFFEEKIPFELTGAQKRVLREIRTDLGRGVQMNRLLQGDVGSGKTMVGLMSMLMALDNGFQACMMAPTEILAYQHYEGIQEYLEGMDIKVAFLSGSVKGKARRALLEQLEEGEIDILLGTHALIEPTVVFKNLGLAIIDEQHRFGVKQRAKLWVKNKPYPPHVLVMTATPIPRTLAMTAYGDLDVSVIDELPPGRTPIKTVHFTNHRRERVFGRIRDEIAKGRQAYIVYPLIEENENLDLLALEEAYEEMVQRFPVPDYQISVVHGRMKPDAKDFEMARFKAGETQIMMATTVIEVGVNVPNATIMTIVHTERFGLSQLHQLRGRVGRGAEESFCILLSSVKLSKESRQRIDTMVGTTDGFKIAEADLRLRGPGMLDGTRQSGVLQMRLADLAQDGIILGVAREKAKEILEVDPKLALPEHLALAVHLEKYMRAVKGWGRIS
ncbi:ATP-dependent DNA helicase RecG [Neolewinella antarctica]|uniref:ATP-dependent DNA helicase RecG n=1 Tax=Neolewinella antarctica TaxID=442734 RepID=A0ABX0XF00_9BACT|nr:ATP-dependent DNA helicase RecG [Neolewinella antarctica]NJC27885.1 ATP-dependent DNA helicase RecG [Neolewinella antarctica]